MRGSTGPTRKLAPKPATNLVAQLPARAASPAPMPAMADGSNEGDWEKF